MRTQWEREAKLLGAMTDEWRPLKSLGLPGHGNLWVKVAKSLLSIESRYEPSIGHLVWRRRPMNETGTNDRDSDQTKDKPFSGGHENGPK